MKGVQCYELFGGIALKNHTFSFVCLLLFHVVSMIMELNLLFQRHSVFNSLTHSMIWCVCIVTMLFYSVCLLFYCLSEHFPVAM